MLNSVSHCFIHRTSWLFLFPFFHLSLPLSSLSPSLIWYHTQCHLVYIPWKLVSEVEIAEFQSVLRWVSTWLQLKQHQYSSSHFSLPWQNLTFLCFLYRDSLMDEILYHFCFIAIALIIRLIFSSFILNLFFFCCMEEENNFPSVKIVSFSLSIYTLTLPFQD